MKSSRPRKSATPSTWRIFEVEAHHRLVISLAAAIITGIAVFSYVSLPVCLIVTWDTFAVCDLTLAWIGMFHTDAQTRVRESHLQDTSRVALCICVIMAAVVGLVGAAFLLGSAHNLTGAPATGRVALSAITVVSSWFMVHTVMALHYTHLYYSPNDDETGPSSGGSLSFPEEKEPDFLDFAYFSFVIGMTCQVSDVQIVARGVRRVVLLHSLIAFGFNTVVVAFTINLASSLL